MIRKTYVINKGNIVYSTYVKMNKNARVVWICFLKKF